MLYNFFFKTFFQKKRRLFAVWDTSASRNGWRVRRTEWTKSSVQINIKRIFKLNATKYLVVCSCVMNEVRAVLDFFSASFASSLHILFLHVKLQCSETTNERIIYTHAPFYTRNNGEKKKSRIVLSVASNAYRERFGTGSKQFMRIDSTILSLSFILSLSLSSFLFLYLSLSLSLLNSKNKRGNFATVCKTNGKKIFFFLLFLFLFFLFKTVDSLTHRKRTILFFLSFKRTQSYASHEMSGAPQFHAGSLNRSESDEQNENARRVIRTDGFYLTKKKGKRKKKEYKLN